MQYFEKLIHNQSPLILQFSKGGEEILNPSFFILSPIESVFDRKSMFRWNWFMYIFTSSKENQGDRC